jgi:hypothetical protein
MTITFELPHEEVQERPPTQADMQGPDQRPPGPFLADEVRKGDGSEKGTGVVVLRRSHREAPCHRGVPRDGKPWEKQKTRPVTAKPP